MSSLIRRVVIRGLEVVENVAYDLQRGSVDIGPIVIMTHARLGHQERNAFEIGRDVGRGDDPRFGRSRRLTVV